MTATGVVLHTRARTVPRTVLALVAGAALAAWSAFGRQPTDQEQGIEALTRIPLALLWPLLAASLIGAGLRSRSVELERSAARDWWPSRATHLLALTALAAALLSLAVPGAPEGFGTAAVLRNTLGTAGGTALGAVLLGARLGWLPVVAYTGLSWATGVGTLPGVSRLPGGAGVWAWPVQPDTQTAAWWTAVLLFVVGSGCYAAYGARPEGGRA